MCVCVFVHKTCIINDVQPLLRVTFISDSVTSICILE